MQAYAGSNPALSTIACTGDILFIEETPIMWAGPVRYRIAACDRVFAMDVEGIVPGHGPATDKAGAQAMRAYLVYIEDETKKRHAAGMTSWDIASGFASAEFGRWEGAERYAKAWAPVCHVQ